MWPVTARRDGSPYLPSEDWVLPRFVLARAAEETYSVGRVICLQGAWSAPWRALKWQAGRMVWEVDETNSEFRD